MFSPIFLSLATGAVVHENAALQRVARSTASAFNVSLSLAATLANGTTIAGADGFDDHRKGTKIDVFSLFPSGSVTKLYTSTAAMRLSEAGKLDLDAPFHTIVDPWLAAQGMRSMKQQWDGDNTIETVTVRQLLQMQSGLADYDDRALKEWTLEHKGDWLPSNYLHNVSKQFLFPPGKGGSYTGIGYVLLGYVLCAASGDCATWQDLDQAALLQTGSFKLEDTIFAGTGPCSQYKQPIVHQYFYAPQASSGTLRALREIDSTLQSTLEPTLDFTRRYANQPPLEVAKSRTGDHCTVHQSGRYGTWYPGVAFKGKPVSQKHIASGGADACCESGDKMQGVVLWTFAADAKGVDAGTCSYYTDVHGYERKALATSGKADVLVRLDDFTDLYDSSCLNGWTMGNIAASPAGITRFYHELFSGRLVSADGLSQMEAWKPLTQGFAPGTQYVP